MAGDKISDEDKALFRQMVGNITPLGQHKKISQNNNRAPKEAPLKNMAYPSHTTTYTHLSNHYHDTVSSDSVLVYCNQSIPRKRLNQLKKGEIPWQARLDLHGFRQDEAQLALCQFIQQHYYLAHRCLLIIHGKGSHQGEAPVLKNLVNHWLKQCPEVLAFHSALPRDGGNGALYVLLKRQRES